MDRLFIKYGAQFPYIDPSFLLTLTYEYMKRMNKLLKHFNFVPYHKIIIWMQNGGF